MTLEDKVAGLSPKLRAQVEDYIDFLLSRTDDTGIECTGNLQEEKEPEEEESEEPVSPHFPSPPVRSAGIRGRNSSSRIILAEERVPEEENPDYIDFADINSRFGHTPKEEEQKGPGRLRRLLDWM
jgi:hypothetical protein